MYFIAPRGKYFFKPELCSLALYSNNKLCFLFISTLKTPFKYAKKLLSQRKILIVLFPFHRRKRNFRKNFYKKRFFCDGATKHQRT